MAKIIYISVDMLRADALECYPGPKDPVLGGMVRTPAFNELAGSGKVFTHCYSHCGYTTNSHATMLTGLYPFNNGVRSFLRERLWADRKTVYEIFGAHGYATCVASDMTWVFGKTDLLGLNRGAGELIENLEQMNREDDPAVYEWILKNRDRDFLLFYHPVTVHNYITHNGQPYEEYKSYLTRDLEFTKRKYAESVNYFDHGRLGGLIRFLKDNGLYDEMTIVLTADHGEALREDFRVHWLLSEQELHVPLIIKHPGLGTGEVDRTVGLVDILPTLCELAGITPDMEFGFDGCSLLSEPSSPPVYYAESFSNNLAQVMKILQKAEEEDASKAHPHFWGYFRENYEKIFNETVTKPWQVALRTGSHKYLVTFAAIGVLLASARDKKVISADNLKQSMKLLTEGKAVLAAKSLGQAAKLLHEGLTEKRYILPSKFKYTLKDKTKDGAFGQAAGYYEHLYAYRDDPFEETDMTADGADIIAELKPSLEKLPYEKVEMRTVADTDFGGDEDDEQISEQLKMLGYLD